MGNLREKVLEHNVFEEHKQGHDIKFAQLLTSELRNEYLSH